MSGTAHTVLLVDDEEFFLRSMVDGFAAYRDRIELLTANNGRVALTVLAQVPVDLVVTDLKMPEMDGFELVAELSRLRPELPVVIMTAFGTPEIENRLKASGITQYLDKPIDFQTLSAKIFETLADSASGHLRGIALPTLLQMVELDRKTCTIKVSSDGRRGAFVFRGGQLLNASTGTARGDDAALEILGWDGCALEIAPAASAQARIVNLPLSELLLEAFRRRDERARDGAAPRSRTEFTALDESLDEFAGIAAPEAAAAPSSPSPPTPAAPTVSPVVPTITKEAELMAAQDKLKELAGIEGFSGAAVYTPTGESLCVLPGDVANLKDVGVLANAVLLNAQKSSLEMGTGRGQQVHVEAERAHILARCLNEGTDPVRSQPGKAHIHLVCVLKSDASIGLAKMRLNSVAEKLAEDFRG